ncbi:MAG: TOBE domain-containing protein, partial [Ruminococcus sp.]
FDYPENKFVAGFIGTPQMNFFDVKIKKDNGNLKVTFANGETQSYNLKNMRKIDEAYLDGEEHEVTLGIRGENISLDDGGLTTTLTIKEILGNTTQMFVKVAPDAPDCVVCLSERNDIKAGDAVKIKFDETKLHLFDKETELSIMSREFGI